MELDGTLSRFVKSLTQMNCLLPNRPPSNFLEFMNVRFNNQFTRKVSYIFRYLKRSLVRRERLLAFGNENSVIQAIFVINLDRQPSRWKLVIDEVSREKIDRYFSLSAFCYRVSAVDGKLLCADQKDTELVLNKFSLKDQYAVDPDPRLLEVIRSKDIWITMTREEVAVCLSHIKCWRRIVEEGRSYALVMEDDIFFEAEFSKKVNRTWADLPRDEAGNPCFDLLYLSYRKVDWGAEIQDVTVNVSKPIMGLWWMSGYVLSYKGAKKMLDMLPITGPVDLWMNLQFSKLDVYCSASSIIFQRNDLSSNNNYSILPILSQIGIQSDKTHLELQQKKGHNPVFVHCENLGQGKAFEIILGMLGYRCRLDRWDMSYPPVSLLISQSTSLLFDAYIGMEDFYKNHEALERQYPNAVFIWLVDQKSISESNLKNSIYGNYAEPLRDDIIINKKKHLVIDPLRERSWSLICGFLACENPPFQFPVESTLWEFDFLDSTEFCASKFPPIYLQHDVTPWVIPIERLLEYGVVLDASNSRKGGKFVNFIEDYFETVDPARWIILEESFPSNLAHFMHTNLKQNDGNGFELLIERKPYKSRDFRSASIRSVDSYRYGRFSIVMRPAKVDGVITAFFLHRNDPWQEIDFEFLGKDTTKVLLNVFYNPGSEHFGWNFGVRGTPVLIELGFDAAEMEHKYTIEWEPHEIRWFIDDILVHFRETWQPSLIPDRSMAVYVNLWPPKSEELAGVLNDDELPKTAAINSISIDSWSV